jgi:lantibiotic modifying enzyme
LGKNSHNASNGEPPADVSAKIFSELACYVLQPASVNGYPEFSALRADLYDGALGLAVFFAAYYRVTKDPQAHKAALQALAPVRNSVNNLLANPGVLRAGAIPIGGLVGMGSHLYGLTIAAEWLNAPDLLDSASALASTITPDLIHTDRLLDVMKGCAGTLLTLISFARVARRRGRPWQPALDLAILCGQHLLRSRVTISELRTWPLVRGLPRAGFVHGVTGISYALTRLYKETKEEKFRQAAYEGFCSEPALPVPGHPGWRDPHSNQIQEPGSWCHGAAGIALGRLSYIESIDEPAIRRDLEEALRLTRTLPQTPADQLCCGNLGRIDVLYTAGIVLGRLQLSEQALDLTKQIIQQSSGGFRFSPPPHDKVDEPSYKFNPSLFLGLAGVGYTLLRQKHADLIPSVHLLEAQG